MYVFQLFDTYSASGSALLWVSLFQSIAIGWIYGKNLINIKKGHCSSAQNPPSFARCSHFGFCISLRTPSWKVSYEALGEYKTLNGRYCFNFQTLLKCFPTFNESLFGEDNLAVISYCSFYPFKVIAEYLLLRPKWSCVTPIKDFSRHSNIVYDFHHTTLSDVAIVQGF